MFGVSSLDCQATGLPVLAMPSTMLSALLDEGPKRMTSYFSRKLGSSRTSCTEM